MQINLLPNLVINRRRQARIKQLATFGLIGWLILLVVAAAGSFGWRAYQNSRLNGATASYTTLNAQVNSSDNVAFRSQAKAVQASLNALGGLVTDQQKLSIVGDRLAQLTPKGVRLRELNIVGDGSIQITANANSYDQASEFLYALEQSTTTPTKDNFTKAVLSGANQSESGVAFTITANFVKAVPGSNQ